MDDDGVTFRTKNGDTVTVPPQVFLRRFLQHVLPDGFVKIRHYGLMASSNATTKLQTARELLTAMGSAPAGRPVDPPLTESADERFFQDVLLDLTGIYSNAPYAHSPRPTHHPTTRVSSCKHGRWSRCAASGLLSPSNSWRRYILLIELTTARAGSGPDSALRAARHAASSGSRLPDTHAVAGA